MRNLAVGLKKNTENSFQILNRHKFAPIGWNQSNRIIKSNWDPFDINNRNSIR